MLSYAIGDVHGHLDKLRRVHELIAQDRRDHGTLDAPIVHVGDLVDRGPDSRGVIQHLIDGIAAGENWVVLQGNHDRLFANFLHDPAQADSARWSGLDWLRPSFGGWATLASYGVATGIEDIATAHAEAQTRVPDAHRTFLEALPRWYRRGEAVFVHAGVRPGIPVEQQAEHDLLWIRGDFLFDTRDHGALVVHGHTPVDEVTHCGNRLAIDTGAAHGGPLSAVVVEGRDAWLLTGDGRVPVVPQQP